MIDLNEMALFSHVVEAKGFTAASRRTGIPLSTVSRKMAKLESRLGVRLIQRSTRHIHLTEIGNSYYQLCRRMLDEAQEAEELIQSESEEPAGTIRIATPFMIDSEFVTGLLAGYFMQFPKMNIELKRVPQNVALIEEGFDCGIQVGELQDSSSIVRRLGSDQIILAASTGYLNKFGEPKSVDELAKHIGLQDELIPFSYTSDGAEHGFPLPRRFVHDDQAILRTMAIKGVGICFLPRSGLLDHLASGNLVEVLPGIQQKMDMALVYPSRKQLSRKLSTFLEYMFSHFESNAPWDYIRQA